MAAGGYKTHTIGSVCVCVCTLYIHILIAHRLLRSSFLGAQTVCCVVHVLSVHTTPHTVTQHTIVRNNGLTTNKT
jgi:hypothetical protein